MKSPGIVCTRVLPYIKCAVGKRCAFRVFVFFTRSLETFCGCGMGIEVVCRMRLQRKPLVLVASVPACGGPTCTIFLMDMRLQAISITAVPTCAGAAVRPYAEFFGIRLSNQHSSSSNVATRSAVECGARGPGAESDAFIISGASRYRRLRHEREASTAQANSITAAPTRAGGHGGPPLRGVFFGIRLSNQQSLSSNVATRSAVECGA